MATIITMITQTERLERNCFRLEFECKKLGKTGLHLGGATQIIFGIKGKRWEGIEDFKPFFNEYWSRPLKEETPEKINVVEEACYW